MPLITTSWSFKSNSHFVMQRRLDGMSSTNRGNFIEHRSFLTSNQLVKFQSEDIDQCWSQWKEWFLGAVENFIPVKTIKDINSPPPSPWIDEKVRHYIRKKYTIPNKYRQRQTDYRKRKLREVSQVVKKLVKLSI